MARKLEHDREVIPLLEERAVILKLKKLTGGMFHGIVTWGITLLVTVYLLGPAIGGFIGTGGSILGSAARLVAKA